MIDRSLLTRCLGGLVVGLLLAGCEASEPPAAGPGEAASPSAGAGESAPEPTEASAPEPTEAPSLAEVEPFETSEVVLEGGDERHALPVYVADTQQLRARGLMGWESLPERAGMLFIFADEHTGGFWMKDTLLRLSIAFADAGGEILAILDMAPCEADPCPTYDPGVTYRYALEVNQGAFDELGVEPGWTLDVAAS